MFSVANGGRSKSPERGHNGTHFHRAVVAAILGIFDQGRRRRGLGSPMAETGGTSHAGAFPIVTREEIQFILDELRRGDA
ncbi:MAG: hypothetical protein MI741_09015 [Rhodospirillales bacterium]|nr:hypothetical protein [Rhodospirillales bacterium]